jgi:hypothetical protein
MTSHLAFVWRRNLNSTVDSICTKCFQTIGTVSSEGELSSAEKTHVCNLSNMRLSADRERKLQSPGRMFLMSRDRKE